MPFCCSPFGSTWKKRRRLQERQPFTAEHDAQAGGQKPVHEEKRQGRDISRSRVPRTGWVYRNVKKPESVSDHMYRMAVMSLTITDPTVDRNRCIKLALVHDMAECIVGDIAPSDNISKAEKHRREEEAMKHLSDLLPEGLKQEIYGLWEEYETQSSAEARLVKEFDLLEMILQAYEYEELEDTPRRLQEFFDSTNGRFHHPEVLQAVSSLNEQRGRHLTKTDDAEISAISDSR